jgi:hypothetical protein
MHESSSIPIFLRATFDESRIDRFRDPLLHGSVILHGLRQDGDIEVATDHGGGLEYEAALVRTLRESLGDNVLQAGRNLIDRGEVPIRQAARGDD